MARPFNSKTTGWLPLSAQGDGVFRPLEAQGLSCASNDHVWQSAFPIKGEKKGRKTGFFTGAVKIEEPFASFQAREAHKSGAAM